MPTEPNGFAMPTSALTALFAGPAARLPPLAPPPKTRGRKRKPKADDDWGPTAHRSAARKVHPPGSRSGKRKPKVDAVQPASESAPAEPLSEAPAETLSERKPDAPASDAPPPETDFSERKPNVPRNPKSRPPRDPNAPRSSTYRRRGGVLTGGPPALWCGGWRELDTSVRRGTPLSDSQLHALMCRGFWAGGQLRQSAAAAAAELRLRLRVATANLRAQRAAWMQRTAEAAQRASAALAAGAEWEEEVWEEQEPEEEGGEEAAGMEGEAMGEGGGMDIEPEPEAEEALFGWALGEEEELAE
jgi:hypothetical protein